MHQEEALAKLDDALSYIQKQSIPASDPDHGVLAMLESGLHHELARMHGASGSFKKSNSSFKKEERLLKISCCAKWQTWHNMYCDWAQLCHNTAMDLTSPQPPLFW
jgi:hypothetical protein